MCVRNENVWTSGNSGFSESTLCHVCVCVFIKYNVCCTLCYKHRPIWSRSLFTSFMLIWTDKTHDDDDSRTWVYPISIACTAKEQTLDLSKCFIEFSTEKKATTSHSILLGSSTIFTRGRYERTLSCKFTCTISSIGLNLLFAKKNYFKFYIMNWKFVQKWNG